MLSLSPFGGPPAEPVYKKATRFAQAAISEFSILFLSPRCKSRSRTPRTSPCRAAATLSAPADPTATAAPAAAVDGACLHHLSVVSATTMRRTTASADPTATALIASATSESWTLPCNTRAATFSIVLRGG